ncbi:MAG: fasciclin domain-containing protein [Balneolaceae bacterium]|nr:MAG: fasciclin domain-containing protein [Balneolaceae bacterium]
MKIGKKFSIIFTALFAIVFVAGLNATFAQGTVVDVISESEDHTIFAGLLAETELDNIVAQPGPFTIVAPTDAAFEAMGDQLDQMREDPQVLQNVIIGHLFQGEVASAEVEDHLGIEIREGDIPASNGVIHVSDQVVMGQ